MKTKDRSRLYTYLILALGIAGMIATLIVPIKNDGVGQYLTAILFGSYGYTTLVFGFFSRQFEGIREETREIRREMGEIRREIRGEVREEMGEIRREMREEIGGVNKRIDDLIISLGGKGISDES